MITLPELPRPRSWTPRYIDFGFTQQPAAGAAASRIDRPGNRYGASIEYPPMPAAQAEVFVTRFLLGRSQGIRVELPLLVPQGAPGAPKVDGAGQTGNAIALKDLTKGYVVREGYWLTIFDDVSPGDGTGYLYKVKASVEANSLGKATVGVVPNLRVPFGNNATVELAHPTIEGLVEGDQTEWQVPVDRLMRLTLPIVEQA